MAGWILPRKCITILFSVVCVLMVLVTKSHCQPLEEHVCEWKTPATGPEVCFVTLMDTTVSSNDAYTACLAHGHAAYLARFPDRTSFDDAMLLNSGAAQYWTSLYSEWQANGFFVHYKGLWGDGSADTWVGLSSTSGCGYVDASGVIQSQDCANQLTGYICQRAEEHVCTWTATSGDDVCFVTLTKSTVSQGVAKSACIAHGDGAYLARFLDQASYDEVMGLGLTSPDAHYWTSLHYDSSWKWGDGSADAWVGLSSTSGCGYVNASDVIQSQGCVNQLTGYICQREAVQDQATTQSANEATTVPDGAATTQPTSEKTTVPDCAETTQAIPEQGTTAQQLVKRMSNHEVPYISVLSVTATGVPAFASYANIDFYGCVDHCTSDLACLSFYHHQATGQCELFPMPGPDIVMLPDSGWSFMKVIL